MTGIKYTDLKIVRDETGAVVTVKSATVDKTDNTKVAIETYEALTDGKAYTVTYTATDEAKTESSATFTATAGVVADIALNTYTIPANTPTVVKYQTLDANGVIIAEAGIGSSAANNMEISVENFNGYQKDDELLLYKTGDTATVKVIYHTYKYNNTNGTEEGKVEKPFTITAVDQSSVIETYDYSVVMDPDNPVDFKRDTLVSQLAMEDDKDGNDPHAKFSFRKADGTDITKNLDYTVESGNENVLLVSGSVAGGAKLTPVGVGATYLVIKNAAGSVIKTLPINVVAKRELATMTVDKSNVVVTQNTLDDTGTQKITVTVMDQYSGYYDDYYTTAPELKSNAPATGSINMSRSKSGNKTTIAITTTNVTPGTYTYTMDLIDSKKSTNVKKVSFSVTVSKQLTSNIAYALVMMNEDLDEVVTKVDTTVTADSYGSKTLIPVIVAKNNGSIVSNAAAAVTSIGALTLKKNGTTVDTSLGYYDGFGDNNIIENAAVRVATGTGYNGSTIVKNLEPGTYTVSLVATIGTKKQNMSTSFVVEDSQKVFEASVKKESIVNDTDHDTLAEVFEDTDYVSFSYASETIDKNEYNYSYADSKYTEINANRIRVDHVLMDVPLAGTGNTRKVVRMKATVNRTFTFGATIESSKDDVNAEITAFNKAFVNTNGTLNASTIASKAAVVASAAALSDNYYDLTSGEQAALANSFNAVIAKADEAAIGILAEGTTSDITVDIIKWFEVEGYDSANQSAYATAINGDSEFDTIETWASARTRLNAVIKQVNDTANMNADITKVETALVASHTIAAAQTADIMLSGAVSGTSITGATPAAVDSGADSTNKEIISSATTSKIVIKGTNDITAAADDDWQNIQITYSNGTATPVTKTYKIAISDSQAKVTITAVNP